MVCEKEVGSPLVSVIHDNEVDSPSEFTPLVRLLHSILDIVGINSHHVSILVSKQQDLFLSEIPNDQMVDTAFNRGSALGNPFLHCLRRSMARYDEFETGCTCLLRDAEDMNFVSISNKVQLWSVR
jgi:hypothetical protein